MNIDLIPELGKNSPICNAALEDKLIIFYGAGISHLWGCERWQSLCLRVVDAFHEKELISYKDAAALKESFVGQPRKLLTILKQKDNNEYVIQMKRFLKYEEPRKAKCPDLFKRLRDIGSTFITTNIDKCFLDEFPEADVLYGRKINGSSIKKDKLIMLHGHEDYPDSWIMTIDEYINHYDASKSPNIKDFLCSLFNSDDKKVVVFIGYGLGELEILDYLHFKIGITEQQRLVERLFLLRPYFLNDNSFADLEQIYFRSFGNSVQIIPYGINESGFRQIYHVLCSWAEFMRNLKSEAPDGVFLKNLKLLEDNL